jgi:CubicO group peptidase (beta-lactamase class C family)
MRLLPLVVSLALTLLPHAAAAQSCGAPGAADDKWPVATPESMGLSSMTLCPLVQWLDGSKQNNVHAVVVVRRGAVVFEHYFSGSDEHWGQAVGEVAFGPETKHDERSVTKSVVALVLGIAVDRGLVKGIDEPVLPYFPE